MPDGMIPMPQGMENLDYFVMQAAFSPEAVELSFVEEATTSEEAAIVTTIAIAMDEEDLLLQKNFRQIQDLLNEMVVRGYQIVRDSANG